MGGNSLRSLDTQTQPNINPRDGGAIAIYRKAKKQLDISIPAMGGNSIQRASWCS